MCNFEYRGLKTSSLEYKYETQTVECTFIVFDGLGEREISVSVPCAIEAAFIDAIDDYCERHGLDQPKTHAEWMEENGFAGRYHLETYPEARRSI